MTLSAPQPHIEKAAVTQRSTTTNVWSVQVSPVSIEPPDFYAVVTTAGSDKNGGGEKVKSSDPASTFCWHHGVTDNYVDARLKYMSPKQKQRTQINSSTLEENENYFVAKLTRPLCQHAQSGPLLCKNQLEEGSSSLNQPRLMSIPRFQQRFLDQTVNLAAGHMKFSFWLSRNQPAPP